MDTIVHITTRAAWQGARQAGEYTHPRLTTDGYLHCSLATDGQLLAVAKAYFVGPPDLVLLVIDPQRLPVPVRYEEFETGGTFFPHVYAPVPVGAVVQVLDFSPQPDGRLGLPSALAAVKHTPPAPHAS